MGHHHHHINRRTFIGQAGCAAMGMTTFYNTILNLKGINAAAGFNSSAVGTGNYKALVCILLSGGADSYNMVIPNETTPYNDYAASRSNLAIPKPDLRVINPTNTNSDTFGFHPSMENMQSLFASGDIAVLPNVGTLIEPYTDSNDFYNNPAKKAPLGLYSHADQVKHWQTGIPNERVATGWSGKMAELLTSANQNAQIGMNMSLSGSNVFQTGNTSQEYAIDRNDGSIGIRGYNDDWLVNQVRKETVDNMVEATYQDIFKQTYVDVTKLAIDNNEVFQGALGMAHDFGSTFYEFSGDPNNPNFYGYDTDHGNRLMKSLEMVAKVISVQSQLNMDRQIFFIDWGGWDHHDELLAPQEEMLHYVDKSLAAFNTAMGDINQNDCVTTFTMSDFARTLTSNGSGSDHGWGAASFVMGGAVSGTKFYGNYPDLALNNPLEVGGGVLIPTVSCDEYFAELALWFGVPPSELATLFPNIGNFYTHSSSNQRPLGFLPV